MIITIDHRESKVIDTIKAEFDKPLLFGEADIDVCVDTLKIGDYMISIPTSPDSSNILAIIERKTLSDYGASFKDSRVNNINNLLALRQETNCKIYYIVEGAMNPGIDELFGGVAYSAMYANMTDIGIIHDIQVIRTKDKLGTAKSLKMLCERYYKLYPQIRDKFTGSGDINQIVEKALPTAEEKKKMNLLIIWSNLISKAKKISKQPSVKASILASRWTLMDWIEGKILEKDLLDVRIDGKILPKDIIYKLSRPLDTPGQIKLVTCIKGISAETAVGLIGVKPLIEVIKSPDPHLIVVNPVKNTKLRKADYEKIVEYCSMRG